MGRRGEYGREREDEEGRTDGRTRD